VYTRWRDKVLAGDSFAHVMALLPAAAMQHDQDVVIAKAVALAGTDPERGAMLARTALALGQAGWVDRIVQPLLAKAPTRALYQIAAQAAAATGRPADALADLEHAEDASSDEPAPIAEVRAELGSILGLAQQLAVQSTGAARDQLVARAMRWGDRWRAVDPNNPQIDQRLGTLLLAVGDRAGAWRQLSSTIERDPWSSAGYTVVAEAFEQQGKLDDALPFWQQAIVIDQTNPTPRLRKAQALLALGRAKDGDALLHQITDQKWHDVWSGVVEQAHEALAHGR
jgi:tetratricopeptide (TPR) repeat protein